MSPTTADVKRLIQSCFPEGTGQYLDWDNPQANVSQFFTAAAGVWKTYGTDIIDTLRVEASPTTVTQNIPVWEAALGLSNTPVAKFGTTTQRRNAIVAWLRQSGSFNLDDIRALVQPYFLYANPSNIQILEMDRAQLTSLHTYSNTTPMPIVPNGSGSATVTVPDDPRVSAAGAILTLVFQIATIDQIRVVLDGPDGARAAWRGDLYLGTGAIVNSTYTLRSPNFAGRPIRGTWTLGFTTGAGAFTLDSWALDPVEGIGWNYDINGNRNGQGLGAGMFEWSVVADPALLGSGFDLVAAQRALNRMKPAHTAVYVVKKDAGGGLSMIYDNANAIYDMGIYG